MPASDTANLITSLVIPSRVAVSDISDPLFVHKKVCVQLLRLDQTDPLLSGNKAFKLIPNLLIARGAGFDTVLSFGGAYSNHIHALAEAGHRFNFQTIAVIRGDDGQPDSPTLQFAVSRGMRLIRVSRQEYRRRNEAQFIEQLKDTLGAFYLIPEGGANEAGLRGSKQLASVIDNSLVSEWPDEIVLACGTGATMAGLISGIAEKYAAGSMRQGSPLPFIRGIAVLKQGEFLRSDIARYLQTLHASDTAGLNWEIETSYHWGGYARFPADLAKFMSDFEREQNILLDPVYTAKMMSAIYQRVAADQYKPGSRLLLLHTGGLQGRKARAD